MKNSAVETLRSLVPGQGDIPQSVFSAKRVPDEAALALIDLVRSDDYDISDLHAELSDLESQVLGAESPLPEPDRRLVCGALRNLFHRCLEATSRFEEHVLEATAHGYAEIGWDSRIIAHNSALTQLLGTDRIGGQCFFGWFERAQRLVLREALEALGRQRERSYKFRRLELHGSDGQRRVCSVELGSVARGTNSGPDRTEANFSFFALVSDLTRHVHAERRAYDEADFGVVRVARDQRIIECNSAAAALLGGDKADFLDCDIGDFVIGSDVAKLREEREKRDAGLPSRFLVRLKHKYGPRSVEVTAVPEFEADGVTRSSTLAFLRLNEAFEIRDELTALLGQSTDPHEIASKMSAIIGRLVPHQQMTVNIFNRAGDAVWPAHIEPFSARDTVWKTRWFPVSGAVHDWIARARDRHGNLHIASLVEWVSSLPDGDRLKTDPTVLGLIEQGVTSSLTVPVSAGDRTIASISLMRSEGDGFTQLESSFLESMQLRNALRQLLEVFNEREQAMVADLTRRILTAMGRSGPLLGEPRHDRTSIRDVARHAAERLSKFYRWKSVGLHQVRPRWRDFHLIASYDLVRKLRKDLEGTDQPLEAGLLGAAYRDGKAKIVRDSQDQTDPAVEYFKPRNDWCRSALTLPIKVSGRTVWMIHIEDDRVGGVGEQDLLTLQKLLGDIEIALERVFSEDLVREVVARSMDATLIVDDAGQIDSLNAHAAAMLGKTPETSPDLIGADLGRFFANPADFKVLRGANRVDNLRSIIAPPGGRKRYVLASSSVLEVFGYRVIYANEIATVEWHIDTLTIEGAMAKAARETRKKLVDAKKLIDRALAGDEAEKEEDLRGRISRALSQVALTYDRIASHLPAYTDVEEAEDPSLIDLEEALIAAATELHEELPVGDWLAISSNEARYRVRGRPSDLALVLKSILEFLNRSKPFSAKVGAQFSRFKIHREPWCRLRITAEADCDDAYPDDPYARAKRHGSDMASLGERGLRRIVAEHGGALSRRYSAEAEAMVFDISLPIAHAAAGDATEAAS